MPVRGKPLTPSLSEQATQPAATANVVSRPKPPVSQRLSRALGPAPSGGSEPSPGVSGQTCRGPSLLPAGATRCGPGANCARTRRSAACAPCQASLGAAAGASGSQGKCLAHSPAFTAPQSSATKCRPRLVRQRSASEVASPLRQGPRLKADERCFRCTGMVRSSRSAGPIQLSNKSRQSSQPWHRANDTVKAVTKLRHGAVTPL